MASIVVLGAGPAGAAVALCLSRRGHDVTVVERDPPAPELSERWERSVPQARQGHSFLAAGTRVLDIECPDVARRLIDAGGRRVPLRHEPKHWNLLARRRLLDAQLQAALDSAPRVQFLAPVTATGLLIEDSGADPPHVFGLETLDGDVVADVVVDAGGRRSPTRRWLADHQIELEVEEDPVRFFYVTRHYRLRPGASFPSVEVPLIRALGYATVLVFPEDNRHFQVTVQLDLRDPTRRSLREPAIFERLVERIPWLAPWLEAGGPLGAPEPFASVGNRRTRTFSREPLVTGLMMVGDTAVHTNPTAGRGVALALTHARALAGLLDSLDDARRHRALTVERWDRISAELFDPWWINQIQIDRARAAEFRDCLSGRRRTTSASSSQRLSTALAGLRDCEVAGAAVERVFNLLSTPEDIYGDRDVMRRVVRGAASGGTTPAAGGPSRDDYERLIMGRTRAGH